MGDQKNRPKTYAENFGKESIDNFTPKKFVYLNLWAKSKYSDEPVELQSITRTADTQRMCSDFRPNFGYLHRHKRLKNEFMVMNKL